MQRFIIFSFKLQVGKNDSNTHCTIKHNAVKSKQHSFIAQLSARVQEVYYFASLLSLCTGVSYKLTEQLMWKTRNKHTVINTKTHRKSKEIKDGAVKKKIFFCFVLNSIKSHLHTHTQEFAHKPINVYEKRGECVCWTLHSLLWFVTNETIIKAHNFDQKWISIYSIT